MPNWYQSVQIDSLFKISQSLEDFNSGNANSIISEMLSKNPRFLEYPEEQQKQELEKLYIKRLKKAIQDELKINIRIIDVSDGNEISFIINNYNQILKSKEIQTQKNFESVSELYTYLEGKEKNLDQQDRYTYDQATNNGNSRFVQWVDFSAYDSSKNTGVINLRYIQDWIDANPQMNLESVSQEKSIKMSQEWHDQIHKHEISGKSDKILRDSPNEAQGGQKIQKIELDEIELDKIGIQSVSSFSEENSSWFSDFKKSVLALQESGIYTVELNTEKELAREGKVMQHCVGGYPNYVENKNCEIYSLRDNHGNPYVTIEMQRNERENRFDIVQIKGKQNRIPINKYRPFVMKWIINNNLHIVKDFEGALIGGMFQKVLASFESLDGYEKIKEVSLGQLTPYKKDFIDSKINQHILLNQSANNDFLMEYFRSKKGEVDKPFLTNENLSEENQNIIFDTYLEYSYYSHYSMNNFALNSKLSVSVQKKFLELLKESEEEDIVASNLASNPALDKNLAKELLEIMNYDLQYASPELKADKDVVLTAIKENEDTDALRYASPDLLEDKDVVLAAVKQNGNALYYASPELRADKDIVLVAVKQNGYSLQYASLELKADKDVVLAAVKQNGDALQYASPELQADKDVVLAAIKQNEDVFQYASPELKKEFKTPDKFILYMEQQEKIATKNNWYKYSNFLNKTGGSGMLRLLLFGSPGTCCFEIGESISDFYDMIFYTIEKVPELNDSYFDDKIKEVDMDTGDFSSGSESKHMVRDPHSLKIEKELGEAEAAFPDSREYEDCLTEEEHAIINSICQGVIVTDIPDTMLIDWATRIIFFKSDKHKAVKWFKDRRKCPTCHSVFHLIDKPPRVIEKCDRCGSDLIRLMKDEPEEIMKQYQEWENSFWKFEESAKKKGLKKINVDECEDFNDVLSRVNLLVRDEIAYYANNWYGKALVEGEE